MSSFAPANSLLKQSLEHPTDPMALVSTFGMMAIVLVISLIVLGAPFESGCQLQEGRMPFAESITL
jgi:hypothetical protein